MTTLPHDPSLTVVSSSRSTIFSHVEAAHASTSGSANRLDVIEKSQKEKKQPFAELAKNRAQLPAPQPNPKDPAYLMLMAEAFSKAFSAMNNSVITETQSYSELQQLNETMSTSVLQSSEDTVKQEVKQIDTQKKVEALEKQQAKTNEILGDVFLAVGILMMVVTLASTIASMGATAPALVEEGAEMIEMTTFVSDEAATTTSTGGTVAQVATTSTNVAATGGDITADATANTTEATTDSVTEGLTNAVDNQQSEIESEANPIRQVEESSSKVTQQSIRSVNNLNRVKAALQWGGKKLLGMTIGAAFGAPSLIKGLGQKQVANDLQDLASLQANLGTAMAIMQKNNMYFQFYQELVQRFGSVIQDETSDASEVVQTYSDIVSTYQQIPYGLANAT